MRNFYLAEVGRDLTLHRADPVGRPRPMKYHRQIVCFFTCCFFSRLLSYNILQNKTCVFLEKHTVFRVFYMHFFWIIWTCSLTKITRKVDFSIKKSCFFFDLIKNRRKIDFSPDFYKARELDKGPK